MRVYDADHIRNVALVGHQGSGKTVLAEAMLHASGAIKRMGSIEEGNTVSDYHPSEIERQMSVFTSLLHVEWKGHKINILDTPGYPDFVGEVIASLKIADTAIFVMNGVEGVQVGTELGWTYADMTRTPSMFVINHLDRSEDNFQDLVAQMQERFGRSATVVQFPAGKGTRSIIDVLLMKQITWKPGDPSSHYSDIAPEFLEEAERLHNELIESIAENDESLMELYFEKGTLTEDEMRKGLHGGLLNRQLYPIFIASATEQIGVSRLMSFIDNVLPAPTEMPGALTVAGEPLPADPAAEPVLLVYRTMAEQHVGEYSYFRVYSGSVKSGMDLENAQTSTMERLGQLYGINGRERDNVEQMVVGDIGALVKLKNTHANNTLRPKGSNTDLEPIEFPEPRYTTAVRPVREGEEDKLAQGLHQLVAEDPSLVITHDAHLNQILLGGQGEMHLDVARFRLRDRYGVDVEYYRPRISYRETIQSQARASYRHKKQTGGAGQFADISMLLEPLNGGFVAPADISVRGTTTLETDWGSKVEFIDGIVGGVIDMRRFFGAIQKGVMEMLKEGPVAGYPVGDVRVVVFDGGMHSVDSNENAFKTAARMCFREAFRSASPVLLEPIHDLEVIAPESAIGEVMGDLNTRRARIQGMEASGVFQKIIASVPEAELYRYSTTLRSLTQGRGLHRSRFSSYEMVPRHVQDKLMVEAEGMVEAG
jgi:elongation factor G